MQPGIELLLHDFRSRERRQQVHVIGHDDEVAHPISLAIKVQQRVCNDPRQPGPFEDTRSEAFIELRLAAPIEVKIKLMPLLVRKQR